MVTGDRPRILVTGYGGFLGAAICRKLLAEGYPVRGLARGFYPDLTQLGVEAIQGDITDRSVCKRACEGVSGVVHTAALAGVWGKADDYEAINVLGTQLVLDAAKRAGCRAMVYTSSPSVTFGGKGQEGIDESVPYPEHWLCHYPRTKAIAERTVLKANRDGGLLTCALRPHLIWGAGDPHLIPRLIERCKQGRLAKIGSGNQLIDTVHVDLAAEAHWLALRNLLSRDPRCGGKPYFITDGAPIACWEWITMILNAAGLSPPQRRIPTRVAYGVGAMLEWCYGLAGRKEEPPMTRFVALQLGLPHYFSIQAAGRDFGYDPRIDRVGILEQMRPWLQQLRGL